MEEVCRNKARNINAIFGGFVSKMINRPSNIVPKDREREAQRIGDVMHKGTATQRKSSSCASDNFWDGEKKRIQSSNCHTCPRLRGRRSGQRDNSEAMSGVVVLPRLSTAAASFAYVCSHLLEGLAKWEGQIAKNAAQQC